MHIFLEAMIEASQSSSHQEEPTKPKLIDFKFKEGDVVWAKAPKLYFYIFYLNLHNLKII